MSVFTVRPKLNYGFLDQSSTKSSPQSQSSVQSIAHACITGEMRTTPTIALATTKPTSTGNIRKEKLAN